MTRSKKLLIALLILSALPISLLSCKECEHTWDKGYEAQAPTLEKDGYRIITCTSCGVRKTEEIPKLTHVEHVYSSKWGGDETHHWLICDVTDCQVVTNKTEHTYVDKHGGGKICQVCRRTKQG